MKCFLTLLFITCSAYVHCQEQPKAMANFGYTEVCVELLFKRYDTIYLTLSSTFDNINRFRELPLIRKGGKFVARFEIEHPVSISITYGDKQIDGYSAGFNGAYLLVEPRENLKITIPKVDSRMYVDIKIEGVKAGPKAALMTTLNQKLEEHNKNLKMDGVFLNVIKNDMAQYAFDWSKKMEYIFAKYKGTISEEALNIIKYKNLALMSTMVVELAELLDSSSYHLDQQYRKLEQLLPVENLVYNDKVWMPVDSDGSLAERASVMYAVENEMNYKELKALRQDKVKIIEILSKYYQHPSLRERIISSYFFSQFRRYGFAEELLQLADKFIAHSNNNSYPIKQLKLFISASVDNQKAGSKAFAFNLIDENKNNVRLSDFRGKVVLLDFNYYGCGGCGQMVPSLKELESYYYGKDLLFISISVDNSFDKFLKAIGKYNTEASIHLNTNGLGYAHEIIKYYQVSSYPTLVLIDKKGNLITARAPDPRRPAMKEQLIEMINKALDVRL